MIPQDVKETIDRYVKQGIPTGSFVQAVLENNLREAVGRADNENMYYLKDIVSYCYNKIPGSCWGSKAKVKQWFAEFKEVSE